MICQVCKQEHPLKIGDKWCDRSDMEIENDRLKAENARYRETLEDIVHCIYSNDATLAYCEKKAREALKEIE